MLTATYSFLLSGTNDPEAPVYEEIHHLKKDDIGLNVNVCYMPTSTKRLPHEYEEIQPDPLGLAVVTSRDNSTSLTETIESTKNPAYALTLTEL